MCFHFKEMRVIVLRALPGRRSTLFHQPTQHVAPTLSMNPFKFSSYFMILRRVYKSALATRDGRARYKELMTKMLRLSPQSVMNGPSAQCEERLQGRFNMSPFKLKRQGSTVKIL